MRDGERRGPTIMATTALSVVVAQVDLADQRAVAHDGGAAADFEHLVHLVRDVDDRDAARARARR